MTIHTNEDRAEQIQMRMQNIRCELDRDFDQVRQSASQLTDWRYYIKNYPWACLGAAAAIGYLVVPRKVHVQNPDVKTLEKLARDQKLVIESNPSQQEKKGVVRSAAGFVAGLALRAATAHLMGKLAAGYGQDDAPADGSGSGWHDQFTSSAN